MNTTPTNIPTTAFLADPAFLAEKNFWYIPLSPRMSRNVGIATPNTHSTLWPPSAVRCSAGNASAMAPTPPFENTR